jgi:hypothetical protein
MVTTPTKQDAPSAHELILRIADAALAHAEAVGQEVERNQLLAELVALFDAELAGAVIHDTRDELPPWRRFPGAFASRYEYVENVVEASETSSYYEAIPLDTPPDAAKRKVALLAQSYRNYPED